MFGLASVLLEHSFPTSALMAKGSGYDLLHAWWWFEVLPKDHHSLQINIKSGDEKVILLKLVGKKKKNMTMPGSLPTLFQLV